MAPGDVSSVPTNRASPKSDARGRAVDAPSAKRRENARPKRGRASLDDARRTRDARANLSPCDARGAVCPPAPRMRRGNPPRIFQEIQASTVFFPYSARIPNMCGIFRNITPNWVQKKRTETRTTKIEVWRKVGRIPNLADGEWHRRSAMRRTSQLCSHRSITPTGDPSIRLASYTALFASPPRILRFTRPPPRCTAPRPP